ncbi:MAG: NifU N-terminal domain-containing protein [Chloroflexota bacterium]|nr:NifU N-terminal domain-containing protein [Chloroflexota bacterium]
MSEYVTVEVEFSDDPTVADLYINQDLTEADEEVYANLQEGDQGSPIAQLLFSAVDGIQKLAIKQDHITITREPGQPWEAIIDEVRDALRDWFL